MRRVFTETVITKHATVVPKFVSVDAAAAPPQNAAMFDDQPKWMKFQ